MSEKVMLGPRESPELRHAVERRGVRELHVVDALDVGDVELALLQEGEQRNQVAPARPRRMLAHLLRENWVEDRRTAKHKRQTGGMDV